VAGRSFLVGRKSAWVSAAAPDFPVGGEKLGLLRGLIKNARLMNRKKRKHAASTIRRPRSSQPLPDRAPSDERQAPGAEQQQQRKQRHNGAGREADDELGINLMAQNQFRFSWIVQPTTNSGRILMPSGFAEANQTKVRHTPQQRHGRQPRGEAGIDDEGGQQVNLRTEPAARADGGLQGTRPRTPPAGSRWC